MIDASNNAGISMIKDFLIAEDSFTRRRGIDRTTKGIQKENRRTASHLGLLQTF